MTKTSTAPAPIAATFEQAAEAAADFPVARFGADVVATATPEQVASAMLRLLDGGIARGLVTLTD